MCLEHSLTLIHISVDKNGQPWQGSFHGRGMLSVLTTDVLRVQKCPVAQMLRRMWAGILQCSILEC